MADKWKRRVDEVKSRLDNGGFDRTQLKALKEELHKADSLLHEEGEAAHFAVRCRPAVVYTGTGGAQMIHFVAEFEHTTGGHRAVSTQSAIDVANLGVQKLDEGELKELVAVPRLSLG